MPRFRCSDPLTGDLDFPDVASVLDAREAALLSADTPMLDTARQTWQSVAAHPEVRAAWIERDRFRPAAGNGLALPELPAMAAVAGGAHQEAILRRQAYAGMRHSPVREETPPQAAPRSGWSRAATLALVAAVVLLGLIGWSVVMLAARLTAVAARAAGI